MAVVSKAVFEKDAPKGLAVGGTWVVDRYVSQNAGLRALADGGALFLVTVRPPDERLWLVAVLEAPRSKDEAWTAAPNIVAVRDVTPLVSELKFTTGKGIAAQKGKLGMSLQTPRALTDADVALLRGGSGPAQAEASSSPKKPAKKTREKPVDEPAPKPAPDAERGARALASLKEAATSLPKKIATELAALVEQAAKSPGKAVAGAKAMAKKLGEGEQTIAIYDAVAAAIVESSAKSKSGAGDCHAAARLVERKLKLKVDLDRAVDCAELLASVGAIWVKEIAQLAKTATAAKRLDLAPAIVRASIATVRAGEVASPALLSALAAMTPASARSALAGWVGIPYALTRVDDGFWAVARPFLAAILETDEGARWAASFAPTEYRSKGWLDTWAAIGVTTAVAARLPDKALELAERVLVRTSRLRLDPPTLLELEGLLAPLLPILRERDERMPVRMTDVGRSEGLYDPTLIELLLSINAPLREDDARGHAFPFATWATEPLDAAHQSLARIGAHPVFAACVEAGLYEFENTGFAAIAAKAAQAEGTRAALERVIDEVVGVRLVERGTLGTFVAYAETVGHLCQPAVLSSYPRLAQGIGAIDPAHLLWRQLQAGILDEWGWPALDAAYDELGPGAKVSSGTFPHLAITAGNSLRIVGPESVVLRLDGALSVEETRWLRSATWVDGDALLVAGNYAARWVHSGARAKGDIGRLFDLLDPSGMIHVDGTPFKKEATDARTTGDMSFCDGAVVSFKDMKGAYQRYEARTGKPLGAGLPPWLDERLTDDRDRCPQEAFLLPVPERSARSPLGARSGLGGFVTWREDAAVIAEGIDGRRFKLASRGRRGRIEALVTFPEREGIHPMLGQAIHSSDGEVPLIPSLDDHAHDFWPVGPTFAGFWDRVWWHLFAPRDPAGSRALAACTVEQATALYRAARAAVDKPITAPDAPAQDLSEHTPGLRVVLQGPKKGRDALNEHPELIDTVKDLFPEITHRRLLAAVAAMGTLAVAQVPRLADLQARGSATGGAEQGWFVHAQVSGLDPFFHAGFDRPGRWGQDRIGQQINDVAEFFFGDRPVPLHRPQIVTPARSFAAWERALFHGSELLLILLGPATSDLLRAQVRGFLEAYRRTPFSTELRNLRVIGLSFAEPPAPGLGHDHLDRLAWWETRYFLRCTSLGGAGRPFGFAALEYAPDGKFKVPPGATVTWEQAPHGALTRSAIETAFALLDTRGPFPLEPQAVDRLVEATGLLREAATLLLAGAHLNELDKGGRAALHVTVKREAHGRADLLAKESHFIVASAIPADPSELYRPLEKGADGLSFVDRLANRWVSSEGKRQPLAMDLVERMEDDIRHPYPPFLSAARALLDPEQVPMLTRDATWVHRPFAKSSPEDLRWGSVPGGWMQHHDEPEATWARRWPDREAFSYEGVARYLKYLSWAYLELPVGDPVRAGAAKIAALTRARLAAPGMLLPIAIGKVRDRDAFAKHLERFGGKPYTAADGGLSATGVDRDGVIVVHPAELELGSGFLVSVRTSALPSPEALDRALGKLGAIPSEGATEIPGAEALRIFPYLAHYRLWISDGFQQLVARLSAPREGVHLFEANPLRSAPEAVEALQRRLDLPIDAAVLYLQLATLPEPLSQRVARYNGWSKIDVEAAAAVLLGRKLIVTLAPKGTTRTWFLPEPLVSFERYPGPVEASKVASLGLVPGKVPPLDVPLPVSPLPALFARRAADLG